MSDKSGHDLFLLSKTRFELTKNTFKSSVKSKIRKLLSDGTNPDCIFGGSTPLCAACCSGNLIIVEILLDHGASVNIQDQRGSTPLHLAASCGNSDLTKLLLLHRASVHCTDGRGETPLHRAVSEGWSVVAKHLVEHGADFNVQNKRGQSALAIAVTKEYNDIVEMLIENGANVNILYHGVPWLKHLMLDYPSWKMANIVYRAGISPYYHYGTVRIEAMSLYFSVRSEKWQLYLRRLSAIGFDICLEKVDYLENIV